MLDRHLSGLAALALSLSPLAAQADWTLLSPAQSPAARGNFGIMGIMKSSGMVVMISDFFSSIATATTLPIYTFFSAGLVNLFVPSGGGQWAIQGPIVIESALKLGVPLPKAIMALAYGDQITNMLQPFWALPLLGITKLKAKEILPYTLILMVVGIVVYILALLLL